MRNAFSTQGVRIEPRSGEPRFTLGEGKIITDSVGDIQWMIGPDRDMSYSEAKTWLNGVNFSGDTWYIPDFDDVYSLNFGERGRNYLPDPLFVKLIGQNEVWLKAPDLPGNGRKYRFSDGTGTSGHVGLDGSDRMRAVAIRPFRRIAR